MIHPFHEKALILVKEHSRVELALIELLQKIESEKVFSLLGYASMFSYCTNSLKLSESESARFIGVSRKCQEVPELKIAIANGEINTSKAKKIISVVTPENSFEWIEKAKELPSRELEKQVVAQNPERAIPERIKPISATRSELKCGLSPELEKKLNRCKELLQRQGKQTMESVLEALTDHFLKTKDPVEKAERAKPKPAPSPQPFPGTVVQKRAIPNAVKHAVYRRDNGACQYRQPEGKRCGSRVFTEVHHIVPVSYGGKHELENLTTFCSAHHRQTHL